MGSSAAELCTPKRQMLGSVLARRFPPTPRSASIFVHQVHISRPQTSGLVRLESMQRLQSIAFPAVAPISGCDRVTHGTHLPESLPQNRLCSIKSLCKRCLSSVKRQDWSKFGDVPFSCQRGANWCQNGQWRACRAPTSQNLTQPDFFDVCTCCAWLGLEMGPASGRKD